MVRALALLAFVVGCADGYVPPPPPEGTPPGGPFVQRFGTELWADGRRFWFVGANRYDAASSPRFTCGRAYDDDELERLVRELRESAGASVLRAWAFATFTDGGRDFGPLDRLIAVCRSHGVRLILTLENEWKDCTTPDPTTPDGRKGGAWFRDGYRAAFRDYAAAVAARYRDEPQIAMWQLMNEAESDDGAALLAFSRDMAAVVKAADPRHLVSLGTIGTGQAGTAGAAYRALHEIDGIDVVEAHDYHEHETAMPGAILSDLRTADALGKPFFVGEAGIPAPPVEREARARHFDAKLAAHAAARTDGFLVWSFYDLTTQNWQGWDFGPGDPLAEVLKRHAAVE